MKIAEVILLCSFLLSCAPVMQGPVTPGASGGTMGPMEYNMDRMGSDYNNFDLSEANPQVCQNYCQNDPACVAWTYVKPGFQGPNPRCWLKNAVPQLTPNPFCVSGVKLMATPSGGGDPSQPEQPAETEGAQFPSEPQAGETVKPPKPGNLRIIKE